jgi:hypothetical protein
MTGAAMGSVVPGIGTGIGAGVGAVAGGLAGLFSGSKENPEEEQRRKMLMDYYAQGNGPAPQAGPAAQSGYSSFRENQRDMITRLEALSRGQGPSLATEQMKMATDRAQSQQSAMANSGRGGPMAAMTAANNSALLGANAGQASMQGRIQEQQMALQQLGLSLHGARGADEANNQFNANEQNQTSLGNLEARMNAMQLSQQQKLEILQMLGGQNAAVAGRPGIGSQLLAGGAGAFSSAQAAGAFKSAPTPGSFGAYAAQGRQQAAPNNRLGIVDPWA